MIGYETVDDGCAVRHSSAQPALCDVIQLVEFAVDVLPVCIPPAPALALPCASGQFVHPFVARYTDMPFYMAEANLCAVLNVEPVDRP